jgi:hypothetical protein
MSYVTTRNCSSQRTHRERRAAERKR